MKNRLAAFLCLIFCVTLFAPAAAAAGYPLPEGVEVTAQAAYFINLDTGIVMFERGADEARSIASLTKLMTALLLVENVSDLAGTPIVAERSLYVPPITTPGASNADIRPGETVSALNMLYAMMLPSGNEAAEAVGYYLGNGNLNNFYALMNARAADLGCTNTHFASTNGLQEMDEGNYSSAHDVALIAAACWKHEIFRTVVGTVTYQMPATDNPSHTAPYNIQNTNRMLVSSAGVYRSYIRGMKTGSTEAAGRCFASVAVNDRGETYLGVVLGTPWDVPPNEYAYSFYDTANIYDWLFANFSVRPSIDIGSPVTEIHVNYCSDLDTLMLYPADDLRTVLPNGDDSLLEKTFDVPESVDAPVQMGDHIGTVTLTLNGDLVGTVDLIAGQDVARNDFLYALAQVKAFLGSLYFRVVCILTVIFLAGYTLLTLWLHRRGKNRRYAGAHGGTARQGAFSRQDAASRRNASARQDAMSRQNTTSRQGSGLRQGDTPRQGDALRQSDALRQNAAPRPDGTRGTRAGVPDPRAARDDAWPADPLSPPAADDADDFDLSFLDDGFF